MARLNVAVQVTEESVNNQRGSYENLPDGYYRLQMEACEVVEKNEGKPDHSVMIKSTFEVLEPDEFAKRKIFGNYNLLNKSEIAQKIGNQQFECFLASIGLTEVPDAETDNLLFHSFVATVGMGKDSKTKNSDGSPEYPAKNEIKFYWVEGVGEMPELGPIAPAANDNKPKPAAAKPATTAAPKANPPGSKPWTRKAA